MPRAIIFYCLAGKGIYVADDSKVKAESSAMPGTGSSAKSYASSGGAETGSGAIGTYGVMKSGEKSITMTVENAYCGTICCIPTIATARENDPTIRA